MKTTNLNRREDQMYTLSLTLVGCILAVSSINAFAVPVNFSGSWSIDLRTPAERQRKVECGSATFKLSQVGDKIVGDHFFATPNCGRVNEGGPESVKGVAIGSTAVLVVTSGRNGGIVMGKASIKNGFLHWQTLEEIKLGEPQGDSPLILGNGVLSRVKE